VYKPLPTSIYTIAVDKYININIKNLFTCRFCAKLIDTKISKNKTNNHNNNNNNNNNNNKSGEQNI
jgi:hypothetical protein